MRKSTSLLTGYALWLSLTLIACVHGSAATKIPTQPTADETTLGPGDIFDVRVFGDEKLSGKYQVSPDGTIRFPFLGVVAVAGKEANEAASSIGQQLKEKGFLRDPQVSVFVVESNSRRISVLGAVAKPGTFAIIPGMTVVHAVSNAGGFTPLASKDETVVTRRVSGKLERYRIPITGITRGDLDDFLLRAGDIIFVPERVF